MTPPTRTVVQFRREECGLYSDETVRLIDESHNDLIRKLHDAFSSFQTPGVIREALEERLSDTSLYEDDYQEANARLVGKSWQTLDLNTAAFLVGYHGCLGLNEVLALLPFHFEILLRADSWAWPFELVIEHLLREPRDLFDFESAHENPLLRQLVQASLKSLREKFMNDAEFRDGVAAANLDRAIQDWASEP